MDSVAGILGERARTEPSRHFLTFLDARGAATQGYSYGAFNARANHVALSLLEAGAVAGGEPVLLVYPPGLEVAVAFFACVKAGAIPVPVPPPGTAGIQAGMDRLAAVIGDTGARTALTEERFHRRIRGREGSGGGPLAPVGWVATDGLVGQAADFAAPAAECLFLQYTSGSTSDPRGVMVTDANVIHNCGLSVNHPRPVGVSWLPHYHDMGLIGYFLFSAIAGGEAYCFSPIDFMRRPLIWLETMSKVGATITTVPNFAFEYCLREDKVPKSALPGLDLSAMRTMVNAAEPVRSETMCRFLDRFAEAGLKAESLTAGYGLAEHTLCVTSGGRGTVTLDDGRQVVNCGTPAPDVDVRICEPETGRPVGDGVAGEVLVSSPSKAAGYWRRPGLSAEIFEGRVVGSDGRYLRTGDIGFLKEGALYICGRAKDMVILRGQNVHPADVEAVVEAELSGLPPGSVAAFGATDAESGEEGLVVLVETGRTGPRPDLKALRDRVRRRLKIAAPTCALVAKGSIVRTSSAKIARGRCRSRWEAGAIEILAVTRTSAQGDGPADTDRSLDGLVERLLRECGREATLEAAGLDSLDLVTISLHIDDLLKAHNRHMNGGAPELFDLRLLQSLRVGDVADLVAELRSGAPDAGRLELITARAARAVDEADRAAMRRDVAALGTGVPLGRPSSTDGRTIVLTGATGFLGSWLLRRLIEMSQSPVCVLVRADSPAQARERLARALERTGWPAETATRHIDRQVTALAGDLALPSFGLDQEAWRRLGEDASAIYHCAADVDYVRNYRSLRPANVVGTAEVIRLAGTGVPKTVHFVSTTFIFGWTLFDRLRESSGNRRMSGLDFGYAQSKWVAERLVEEAADRGLDARVYRPSLVTASRGGHFVRRDITARVLGYMIRHGITVDAENQISFVPVDVCATNIVAISLLDNVRHPRFHLTDDRYYNIADVCAAISEDFGYRFRTTDISGFIAHINRHCTPADDLYPLVAFFNRNADRIERMKAKRYDNRNYRRARALSSLAVPHPPLAETIGAIVSYLQRERLV